jgi:hypothetical protein
VQNNISVSCTVSDTRAPTWSGNATNDTLIYQGETVRFNVSWSDAGSLNYSLFSTNLSGAWVNDTLQALSGATGTGLNYSYINQTPGQTVGWMFYANDSVNNWNATDIWTFRVLGIKWNDSAAIAFGTIEAGTVSSTYRDIKAYGNNSNVQISCSGSCTAIQQNFSTVSMADLQNITVRFNCSSTAPGSYSAVYSLTSANDTVQNNISVSCTVSDTRAPTWSGNATNDTLIYQGETVRFNVSWSDAGSLNYSIFSTNLSGVWVNDTPEALSGTSDTGLNYSYINQTPGQIVGWMFYANDSTNNWNQTGMNQFRVLGVTWNNSATEIGRASCRERVSWDV